MKIPGFGRLSVPDPPPDPPPVVTTQGTCVHLLTLLRVAEEVWRLNKRVNRVARATSDDSLVGVRDSVARLEDLLQRTDVQVVEHDGQPYDEGLRLDIVHVEGEVTTDQPLWVVETVKPTVLVHGKVVSTGQVILGTQPPEVI